MKVDTKRISESQYEISGSFLFDEIRELYNEELEKIRKEVKIPGFRPGKAPIEIIESRYGEEVKSSSVRRRILDVVKDETNKKEKWVDVIGYRNLVWNERNGEINFSVEVEVIPRKKLDLDVKVNKGKDDEIRVSDEEVKREIELLRERYATLENSDKDEIGADDIGVFDLTVKDIRTGRTISREKDRILDMSRVENWFKNIALGMKKGESKESVVYFEGGDKKIFVLLKDIKRKSLPSEEDLAKTLGFDSVEKLKEDIAKRIEENRRNSLIETKYLEYIFKVAEKNKIQPPRGLISNNFEDIKNRNPNMSDEDAQNLAIFRATERVILMNFAEDNDIEVAESDVEDFINKLAVQLKATPERIRKALKVSDHELITFIRLEKAREKMRQKLLELLQ